MRVELHPTVSQESSASEAHMNVYAWSYATLWNAAVQAAAGRVPHESLASRPRPFPRQGTSTRNGRAARLWLSAVTVRQLRTPLPQRSSCASRMPSPLGCVHRAPPTH